MTVHVSVMARIPGEASDAGIGMVDFDLPAERVRVEDLVRSAVEEQVRTLTARRKLAVLEVRERMERQYGPEPGRREAVIGVPTLDVQQEIDRALDACRAGRCIVVVAGEPVTDLDAEITLQLDTRVQFLRLVPLQGG